MELDVANPCADKLFPNLAKNRKDRLLQIHEFHNHQIATKWPSIKPGVTTTPSIAFIIFFEGDERVIVDVTTNRHAIYK